VTGDVTLLAARVAALETQLAELNLALEDARDQLTATAPDAGQVDGAGLDLPALEVWVSDWLLPTFRRPSGGGNARWCPQWWCHPEAVLRLAAVHAAFAQLCALHGTGTATWLRDVLDPQLAALMSDLGPFRGCGNQHRLGEQLPTEPLPAGDLVAAEDGESA